MGATTTQGTGAGAAVVNGRKNSYLSLQVSKHIGPRVVAAGTTVLHGPSGLVLFPALIGSPSHYCIQITNSGPEHAYISSPLSAGDPDWSFGVTAGNGDTVHWCVIKIG